MILQDFVYEFMIKNNLTRKDFIQLAKISPATFTNLRKKKPTELTYSKLSVAMGVDKNVLKEFSINEGDL